TKDNRQIEMGISSGRDVCRLGKRKSEVDVGKRGRVAAAAFDHECPWILLLSKPVIAGKAETPRLGFSGRTYRRGRNTGKMLSTGSTGRRLCVRKASIAGMGSCGP